MLAVEGQGTLEQRVGHVARGQRNGEGGGGRARSEQLGLEGGGKVQQPLVLLGTDCVKANIQQCAAGVARRTQGKKQFLEPAKIMAGSGWKDGRVGEQRLTRWGNMCA